MEITTLCSVIASLRVLPNRSQFFQYESFSVSCGEPGNSSQWRVKRNISTGLNKECTTSLNSTNEMNCIITDSFPFDTGVYWCESGAGRCSDAVNITVSAGPVIMKSPVLPVMDGDDVTLSCMNIYNSSSNLTTDFYKDGVLMATSSTGNTTIRSVSKSDEGLYMCNISGVGESPDSWLAVRAGHPEAHESPLVCILLPVVAFFLLLTLLMLFCLWRRRKEKVDPDVSYIDVTITQEVEPKRIRDSEHVPTVYSTVKLGTT